MKKLAKKSVALLLVVLMLAGMIPMALATDVHFLAAGVEEADGINRGIMLAEGEVRTGKIVENKGNGKFEITLEAVSRQFTGSKVERIPIPYDVVFVLDYTGSMGTGDNSKLARMQDAATAGIEAMLAGNTPELYNRVAAVGYRGSATVMTKGAGSSTTWAWNAALQSPDRTWLTGSSVPSTTWLGARGSQPSAMAGVGGTNISAGLNMAQQVLANSGANYTNYDRADIRIPVIILLTDGEPNRHYNSFNAADNVFINFANTGTANARGPNNNSVSLNNQGNATGDTGTTATFRNVVATIRTMKAVKDSIDNMQLYTIGFDLNTLTAAAGALAYAAINPIDAHLMPRAGYNTTAIQTTLRDIRDNLPGLVYTGTAANPSISTNPYNVVDMYRAATLSGFSLAEAFADIVGSIQNADPITGALVITDYIDTRFAANLVDGVQPGNTSLSYNSATGQVTWTITGGNLSRMKSAEALGTGNINNPGDYSDGFSEPNSITFEVELKESAKVISNVGSYIYTNTNNWRTANFASFRMMDGNPFYTNAGGTPKTAAPADGKWEYVLNNAGESITQRLRTTGWVTLQHIPLFTVTVKYHINDGDGPILVDSMTRVTGNYLNGADYYWTEGPGKIQGDGVPDSLTMPDGTSYYFVNGQNRNTGVSITDSAHSNNLTGAITVDPTYNGHVEINLYYTKNPMPPVPLSKSVVKAENDMDIPSGYNFTFALYIDNGGYVKVTNDLTFNQTQITEGTEQAFVWNLPVGVTFDDLRNAKLYINEVKVTDWDSPAMNTHVEYGQIINGFNGFAPATRFNNYEVLNTYTQPPVPVNINLLKYFEGNGIELQPPYDGAEMHCTLVESEFDVPAETEIDYADMIDPGHDHAVEGCVYNDDLEAWDCGEEEAPPTYNTKEISPAIQAHKHSKSCYSYEFKFNFNVTYQDNHKAAYSVQRSIEVPHDTLVAIMNGTASIEVPTFNIPTTNLPDTNKTLQVSITEVENNFGWTPRSDYVGISVNAYGVVTYPPNDTQPTMINDFGGIKVPSFGFSKTLVGARSSNIGRLGGHPFIFDLYEGQFEAGKNPIDSVTLTTNRWGMLSGSFTLPQFSTITSDKLLTLVERPGTDPTMTYDSRQFTIIVKPDGVVDTGSTPVIFVNTLLDPIEAPEANVEKVVFGTTAVVQDFTFNWSYTGYRGDNLGNMVAASGNGSNTITVNNGSPLNFSVVLPPNFTGRFTVNEVLPVDGSELYKNWIFDAGTRTIDYVLGVPVGGGVVRFTNNYFAPSIDLSKTSPSTAAVTGETVHYRIEVINTGSEPLAAVVIQDDMFSRAAGAIVVEDPVLNVALANSFNAEANTITLTANLLPGASVLITYSVVMNDDDSGAPVVNTAYVTANRTLTVGERLESEDDHTVTVDIPSLNVLKQVAAYTTGADLDSITEWANSVSFTNTGFRAVFKITITNEGKGVLYVTNITDTFPGVDMTAATFFYNGDEYVGLEALEEAVADVGLVKDQNAIEFYFITDAINAAGTRTNIVAVTAEDEYGAEYEDDDDADVVTTVPQGGGNPPALPPDPEDGEIDIEDDDVPLGEFPEDFDILDDDVPLAEFPPEEEFEILEDIVPLSEMPRTGVESAAGLWLFGLLGSFGAGLAGVFGIKKGKKKDD